MNLNQHAQKHNGVRTWGFSQADLGVWLHYRTMGICAALSANWIKYHAHDDSLANHLGYGGVGRLNVGTLKQIAQEHKDASKTNGSNQRHKLGLWLKKHGIVSMSVSRYSTCKKEEGGREVLTEMLVRDPIFEKNEGVGDCPNIENEIVNALKKYNTCYARINFFSRRAGHSVAVWLGQPTFSSRGDACFFDPNYGEYWFENKQDFFLFFPGYYRSKYKSFPWNFAHRWEVLPCAKKI